MENFFDFFEDKLRNERLIRLTCILTELLVISMVKGRMRGTSSWSLEEKRLFFGKIDAVNYVIHVNLILIRVKLHFLFFVNHALTCFVSCFLLTWSYSDIYLLWFSFFLFIIFTSAFVHYLWFAFFQCLHFLLSIWMSLLELHCKVSFFRNRKCMRTVDSYGTLGQHLKRPHQLISWLVVVFKHDCFFHLESWA